MTLEITSGQVYRGKLLEGASTPLPDLIYGPLNGDDLPSPVDETFYERLLIYPLVQQPKTT